jgi:hypothetical protein
MDPKVDPAHRLDPAIPGLEPLRYALEGENVRHRHRTRGMIVRANASATDVGIAYE